MLVILPECMNNRTTSQDTSIFQHNANLLLNFVKRQAVELRRNTNRKMFHVTEAPFGSDSQPTLNRFRSPRSPSTNKTDGAPCLVAPHMIVRHSQPIREVDTIQNYSFMMFNIVTHVETLPFPTENR